MNSALKPVLSTSGPQNPAGSAQINKPMHPQGTPTTYGQPPSHMQPSLVNLPHNQNTAHAHPNSTPNHYSLNVPSAPQHYVNATQPPVPLSSHPAAAASQPAPQIYNPPKNVTYSTGYQPNLGHTTNVSGSLAFWRVSNDFSRSSKTLYLQSVKRCLRQRPLRPRTVRNRQNRSRTALPSSKRAMRPPKRSLPRR